jgi:hypothetical protein
LSQAVDKAIELGTIQLSNLIDTVKQSLPQATQAILDVIRIDSLGSLIFGFVLLGIGILLYIFMLKAYKKTQDDYSHDGWIPLCCLSGLFSFISLFSGCTVLFNIWNWVGLFQPKLELVHQLIQKVLG